jgi:uncharacterized protein YjiS (DUF1127 family)
MKQLHLPKFNDMAIVSEIATGMTSARRALDMPRMLSELPTTIKRWHARRWHRRGLADLAKLDERTLRDLGIDPDMLRAEATKPFWRP